MGMMSPDAKRGEVPKALDILPEIENPNQSAINNLKAMDEEAEQIDLQEKNPKKKKTVKKMVRRKKNKDDGGVK